MTAADKLASITEAAPNAGVKILQLWTDAGNENDFAEFTLANYGITEVYNVLCQVHTTDNSVIVTEAATTAVSGGKLKVTFPSGNDAKKRSILVFGK